MFLIQITKTKYTMLLHDNAIPTIDYCVSMRLFFASYEELWEKQGWITTGSMNVSLAYLLSFY